MSERRIPQTHSIWLVPVTFPFGLFCLMFVGLVLVGMAAASLLSVISSSLSVCGP